MYKKIALIFEIAAVFIGTLVGAGLASGQEIKQFFTFYGSKSFIGIILCCFIYIYVGTIIINLSIKHDLGSYNEFISLISPNIFGKFINVCTSVFLVSSASIILAGGGSLLNQYFGLPKIIGTLIMAGIAIFTLFRNTKGLIEVNSFIVPSLLIVVTTVFILSLLFYKDMFSISYVRKIPYMKKAWLYSALIYSGYNLLSGCGVLVPLSKELKNKRVLVFGTAAGSIGLTILCIMINLLLLLNVPYIFHYEIPLLYIANRFGKLIQIMLLCIIWLEMFSTEVSDVYSLSKTLSSVFNISYKKSVLLIIAAALPISQIGFVNLITFLYPCYGVVGFIFVILCIIYVTKDRVPQGHFVWHKRNDKTS